MNTLDVRKIEDAVISAVAKFINKPLSDLNRGRTGTPYVPAVVRAGQMGLVTNSQGDKVRPSQGSQKASSIPDYPYCVVSYNTSYPDGSEHTHKYWDSNEPTYDEDGTLLPTTYTQVTEIHSICSINVTFYGNDYNSADGIAQKFHSYLELDVLQDYIEDKTEQQCRLRNKSRILPSDVSIEDTYLETRGFDIFFAVKDVVSIPEHLPQQDTIDRIIINTEEPLTLPTGDVQGKINSGVIRDGAYTEQNLHVNVDTQEK